jgi:hypothetical protein
VLKSIEDLIAIFCLANYFISLFLLHTLTGLKYPPFKTLSGLKLTPAFTVLSCAAFDSYSLFLLQTLTGLKSIEDLIAIFCLANSFISLILLQTLSGLKQLLPFIIRSYAQNYLSSLFLLHTLTGLKFFPLQNPVRVKTYSGFYRFFLRYIRFIQPVPSSNPDRAGI